MTLEPHTILVGEDEQTVFVRLVGRGSFQNSVPLKRFLNERIQTSHRHIDLDLGECTGMDSTFLGTLAGLGLKLMQTGGGLLSIRNLSPNTRRQLTMLGVDQLDSIKLVEAPPPEEQPSDMKPVPEQPASRRDTTELMLQAHEDLMDIDPKNKAEFRDLTEILRDRLNRMDEDA